MDAYKAKIVDLIRANFEMTEDSQAALADIVGVIDDVSLSYGNCTLCWGRGYTVRLDGDAATKEQRDPKLEVDLCDCSRGLQLKIIME